MRPDPRPGFEQAPLPARRLPPVVVALLVAPLGWVGRLGPRLRRRAG